MFPTQLPMHEQAAPGVTQSNVQGLRPELPLTAFDNTPDNGVLDLQQQRDIQRKMAVKEQQKILEEQIEENKRRLEEEKLKRARERRRAARETRARKD